MSLDTMKQLNAASPSNCSSKVSFSSLQQAECAHEVHAVCVPVTFSHVLKPVLLYLHCGCCLPLCCIWISLCDLHICIPLCCIWIPLCDSQQK